MSKKWTNQQKLLHAVKSIGGAKVALPLINFTIKWGWDRVNTLHDAVNKMGIDKAINILDMANKLGGEHTEKLLSDTISLADKCTNTYNNVISFRKRA